MKRYKAFLSVRIPVCIGLLAILATASCKWRKDPVLARVGKLKITESEFQRKLSEIKPEYQNYVLTPNGRRQFLDILVREKMILAAAVDGGVAKSPEYKTQLEKLETDEAERLAEGKDYLLTQMWLADLRKKGILTVTDEEIRQYYQKYSREVEVRHILLASPDEAEAVLKKVRSGGHFASVAEAKSLDADTATVGGKMSPAIRGEIIPELEDVVFRSRVGEVVGPVRSKFGYHVLRKESEKPISLVKAEERIRRVLEKQKLDDQLRSMQSRYRVEVLDAQFN